MRCAAIVRGPTCHEDTLDGARQRETLAMLLKGKELEPDRDTCHAFEEERTRARQRHLPCF